MSYVVAYEVYVIKIVGKYECVLWFVFVVVREMSRAYSFVCRMFGRPKSLLAMWRSFFGMYTPEPAKLPMQGCSDGMNKPFV